MKAEKTVSKTAKASMVVKGPKQKNDRVLHVYYEPNAKGNGWKKKERWEIV